MAGGRVRVGVSRCLLGEAVRYDGRHKHCPGLVAELARHGIGVVALCPEIEAGLGVPRPPVQLVRMADGLRVREVAAPHTDRTAVITAAVRRRIAALDGIRGFVLKSASPSCGISEVPVYEGDDGTVVSHGGGLFVRFLRAACSDLPLVDEEQWRDPRQRKAFLQKVLYRLPKQDRLPNIARGIGRGSAV